MLVSYQLTPVNRWTWDDAVLSNQPWSVTSAQVTKEITDGACLIDSGTFTVSAAIGEEFVEGWYRLNARVVDDDGESSRIPLATLWVYPTDDTVDHGRLSINLSGTSVLSPLVEREILTGDFVAKGASAAKKIISLIRDASPAPVSLIGDFTLNDYYVFDPGTSYLDIVWGLLRKAGWCMQIKPDGRIVIQEKPTTASYRLDRDAKSLLRQGVRRSYSRAGIPNRLKVIDRFGTEYVVENHQANSRTSYEARGRWIDSVDTAPQPKDDETIQHYTRRQLELASTVSYIYSYSRNWVDNLVPFDIIEAYLPNDGITGDLRITRQQITCGTSLKVDESAGYEVKEFIA